MKKFKRRLLMTVALACGVIALWLAVQIVTAPSFLTPRVERVLSQATATDCRLSDLDFRVLRGTRVGRVEVFPAGRQPEQASPFVVLEDIDARHRWSDLLGLRYRVDQVRIGSARIEVTPGTIEWVTGLRGKQTRTAQIGHIPAIQVEEGSVSVNLPDVCEPFIAEHVTCLIVQDQTGQIKGAANLELNGATFRADLDEWRPGTPVRLRIESPGVQIEALPVPQFVADSPLFESMTFAGEAKGAFSLEFPIGGQVAPSWKGEVAFEDLSLSREGMPFGVTDLEGECLFTNRGIELANATGSFNKAPFRVDRAEVRLREGCVDRIAVRGAVRELDVTPLSAAELPTAIGRPLARMGLTSGVLDLDFDFVGRPDEIDEMKVDVLLTEAQARPEWVPVQLDDMAVKARLGSGGVWEIEYGRAAVNGARLEARGRVRQGTDGGIIPDLDIRFTDVPLDDQTLELLPPTIHETIRKLGLEGGRLEGDLRLGLDQIDFDGYLSAVGATSQLFPYSLQDLSGRIRWSSSRQSILLENLGARHGSGSLHASGVVGTSKKPSMALVLEGHNLPLDRELRSLLPAWMQTHWDQWNPAGRFDVSLQMGEDALQKEAGQGKGLAAAEIQVYLKDVSAANDALGIRAERIEGNVLVGEDAVKITGVKGQVLGLRFEAEGSIRVGTERPSGWLRISTPRRRLTTDLLSRWPEQVVGHVHKLDSNGEFELTAELWSDPPQDKGVAANLTVVCHELALQAGDVPLVITGTIASSSEDVLAEKPVVRCQARLERIRFGDRLYGSDLMAGIEFSDNTIRLPRLDMKAFGGSLVVEAGSCELPSLDWKLKSQISHLDLGSLVTALGVEGEKAPSGALRSELELGGRGFRTSTLTGQGEIQVDRGRLYDLPVVVSVLNILNLQLPTERPLSEGYAAFRVADETLHVDDLLLSRGSVPLHCRGTVGMKDGLAARDQALDLLFTIPKRKGLVDYVPVLSWAKHLLTEPLRSYVLQARVTGTAGDYKVRTVLEPIRAPITSLWNLLRRVPGTEIAAYVIPE